MVALHSFSKVLRCHHVSSWLPFTLGILFPYFPNKLTPFGFLSPNEVIVGNRPVLWGKGVSWTVSLLCIVGVLVFAFELFSRRGIGSDKLPFRCSSSQADYPILLMHSTRLFYF